VELGRRAGGEPVAGTRRRRARRRGGEDWGIRVGTSEDFLYVGLQFLMGYCWKTFSISFFMSGFCSFSFSSRRFENNRYKQGIQVCGLTQNSKI
jgi:hypothetical protein